MIRTLDAIVAVMVLFYAAAIYHVVHTYTAAPFNPPEAELAQLLSEPGFVQALYDNDSKTLAAYMNSFVDEPCNLTVWGAGGRVLSVGYNVKGFAATAVLPGWRGRAERLIVSLRCGG